MTLITQQTTTTMPMPEEQIFWLDVGRDLCTGSAHWHPFSISTTTCSLYFVINLIQGMFFYCYIYLLYQGMLFYIRGCSFIVIFIFYQGISMLSGDVLLLLSLSFIGQFPCYKGMFFYCYLYLLAGNFFVIRRCSFIVIFIFYWGNFLVISGCSFIVIFIFYRAISLL